MRTPSARTRKIAGLSAGPLAVLAAGALVWQGSTAAFTATTNNPGNNWTTGKITLTDNDADAATFTVVNLAPGGTGSKCLTVTANSTVDVDGKIYASVRNVSGNTDAAKEFPDHLKLTMEAGTGTAADCSDFTRASTVLNGSLSTLGASTTPTAAGTAAAKQQTVVQYKVSYTFDVTNLTDAEQTALMSKTTGAELVWELKAGTGA